MEQKSGRVFEEAGSGVWSRAKSCDSPIRQRGFYIRCCVDEAKDEGAMETDSQDQPWWWDGRDGPAALRARPPAPTGSQ